MKQITIVVLAALAACAVGGVYAGFSERPVGADGLDAGYATDAYPGFEPSEDKEPEFKERSFWYSVKRETPAEQFDYARDCETNGYHRAALRGYEALVREWPESEVCAEAQRRKAGLLTRLAEEKDDMSYYGDAFAEYDYLLHFYPGLCNYALIADLQYKLANVMLNEKKTFFGVKYASNREKRRRFERVVRLAPGAEWVPDALLTIGDLRVDDGELAEASVVYNSVVTRFPKLRQAREAVFKSCKCNYDLVNENIYNDNRCRNAVNGFKAALARYPDLNEAELLKLWIQELEKRRDEDAWQRARFYDTRQRSKQTAVAAYESFLKEYPASDHADEARSRIEAIKNGAPPLRK